MTVFRIIINWQSFIVVFMLSSCITVQGQNLIPNPGFDTYTDCPDAYDQVYLAAPWVSPNGGTPDFYNNCAGTSCNVCVPYGSGSNSQLAHSGSGYSAIFVHWSASKAELREYIQTPLLTPLIAGNAYRVSFYVNLSNQSILATNSIGAYLSETPIARSDTNYFSCCSPQINALNIIRSKRDWTLISGCFMASGNEQYLTIGNFNDSANTMLTSASGGKYDYSFYYVDDVSVISADSNNTLGNDTTLCYGDSITLDATTPNGTYLWQDSSTNQTLNATQKDTYWVETTDDCGSSIDTILINYNPMPTFDIGKDSTLCPGATLSLDATQINATYLWQDHSTKSTLNISKKGTYWVEVSVNNCSTSDTVIISEECDIFVNIPNILTPNNDGINDEFCPYDDYPTWKYHIKLYSRWGNEVYDNELSNSCWPPDEIPDGIYYWEIRFKFLSGNNPTQRGWVQITR